MKRLFITPVFLLLGGLTLMEGMAQTPAARRSPSYYTRFWQASPFTLPAPKAETTATEIATPLSNWALSGFAEIGEKKIVILQNKSKPEERLTVISGVKNDHNIEIMEIQRGLHLQDRVRLKMAGSVEGWVAYDPVYLKLKELPKAPQEKKPDANADKNRRR